MAGNSNNSHHTRFTNNDNNNSPTKNNYTSPTKLSSPANISCSTCNTTNPTFSKSQLKKKTDRKCVQCIEKLNNNTPPMKSGSKKSTVNDNMNGAPYVNQPSVQHNDNDNNTSTSPQSTAKKEKKKKKRKRSKKDDTTTNNEQQADSSTNNEIEMALKQHKDYEECKATVSKYFQTNNNKNNNKQSIGIAADTLEIGTMNSDSDDMKVSKSSTASGGSWSPMQSGKSALVLFICMSLCVQ